MSQGRTLRVERFRRVLDGGRSRAFDLRALEGAWFLFRWPATQT